MSKDQNPYERNYADGNYRKAVDLGPSGFDPHAPYQPIEPNIISNSNEEKNLALLAHLLGCVGAIFGSVFGFAGPLIIWLTQKDKSVFVEQQAKEALNFQITMLLAMVVCTILMFASCGVLFPILFVPMVLQIVLGIIATMSVSNGNAYRYPVNIRLIK